MRLNKKAFLPEKMNPAFNCRSAYAKLISQNSSSVATRRNDLYSLVFEIFTQYSAFQCSNPFC